MPKYRYRITVGDWSKDGHNQSDDFIIITNCEADAINRAHDAAAKQANVYLTRQPRGINSILAEYEEAEIAKDDVDQLRDIGVDCNDFGDGIDEDGGMACSSEDVAELYLRMAKTQLPNLKWQYDKPPNLVKGIGYGVFC